jgi:serine phosphatase RsbU (regulator of sigma subunit)
MDRDAELLKDKVLLLLARERELLTLRRGHARVSAWLTVAHSLSELVSTRTTMEETYRALAGKLKSQLEFQKVIFLPLPSEPSELRRLIDEEGLGLCNEPDTPALAALSREVGLHRFMWCRLVAGGGVPTFLLVAGYDREKAAFYSPFTDADFGHFKSMGQHLGLLLRNATLIKQLEEEKTSLEELNQNLEQRVAERTDQIARVNRGLNDALAAVRDRERRLRDDLQQARSFQQSILPLLPRLPDLEVDWVYRPLEMVGGDVFDVFQLAPGHLRVFLADAAGHGVQASLRTIVLKSEYDRLKVAHPSPDRLFEEFNRRLAAQYSPGEMVCTACCFDLITDSADGSVQLRYVNAAHPGVLWVGAEGARELYQDGPFLGLRFDISLPLLEARLQRGDALFAFSDGLCDQLDGQGRVFSLAQSATLALRGAATMATVSERIMAAFDSFRGPTVAVDDITLIGVRVGAAGSRISDEAAAETRPGGGGTGAG